MIRFAGIDDISALVDLAFSMHGESPVYRSIDFDVMDMRIFFETCIENKDRYCVILDVGDDGKIMGMFGGMIVPYMFNLTMFYSVDFGLYVAPEYRGGMAVVRLIKAYEAWAAERGIPPQRMRLGESTGTVPEKVEALFHKLGYARTSTGYTKEV